MYDDSHEEFYEGTEPERDIDELNKATRLQKYSSITISTNKYDKKIEPSKAFDNLKMLYDGSLNTKQTEEIGSDSTGVSEDENPVSRFLRVKSEIDLIEKDMNFYAEHKELYKSEVPYEKSLEEFQKLKGLVNYIDNSEKYLRLLKIMEQNKRDRTNLSFNKLRLLNKTMYKSLDSEIASRLKNIKNIKEDNPVSNKNIEYELFVTPETEKVREFTRIMEIQHTIKNIENKIGYWNIESKKKTLASVVINVRDNIRLFDKNFKEEIQNKIEELNKRIIEIQSGNEEFYKKFNKEKVDDLYNSFSDSKDVEDTIYNIINKMESLKNIHEEIAFISLKVKELIERQEKVKNVISTNNKLLDYLQENVKNNIEVMKKNIEIIQNKLK